MSIINKIYTMDIVVVVGTLLVLVGAGFYARPLIIAPLDNITTTNSSVLFSIERGESILIDDNPEFTSPETVVIHNTLTITLRPGTYYWKVVGVGESEIRKLVVSSRVELRLQESGDKYTLVNEGNVLTNVTFLANESVITSRVIAVHEVTPSEGTRAEGREHE